MRFIYCTLIFIFLQFFSVAKNNTKENKFNLNKKESNKLYTLNYEVFKNSIIIGDTLVARLALHEMLAIKPDDSIAQEQLIEIYFNSGNFIQSFYLSQNYIRKNILNEFALSKLGKSAELIHRYSDAQMAYDKLFYITNNPDYEYLVALMQYNSFRYYEAIITLDNLLKSPSVINKLCDVYVNDDIGTQHVPLSSVIWNLKGLIQFELKDFINAKKSVDESLKIFPDYFFARKNLEQISNSLPK